MKLNQRDLKKYLTNPQINSAVCQVLVKTSDLFREGHWAKHTSYANIYPTYNWHTGQQEKPDPEKETPKYSLVGAYEKVESNAKLREIVEGALGWYLYSDEWFSTRNYKSLYTWNSSDCKDANQAIEMVENTIMFVLDILEEDQLMPKAEMA